jgi:signal recognition particle subunit SRP54
MKKMGKGGGMKQMIRQMMGKGGLPDPSRMTPEQLAEAARGMKEGMGMPGGAMPGLPRGITLPAGLSGLMRKK